MGPEVVRSDHRWDPRAGDNTTYRRLEEVDKGHPETAVGGTGGAQAGWGLVQPQWQ
jgi:hypothetical protein